MDEIKISAKRLSEPNLQKLARALLSIARREVATQHPEQLEVEPQSGKDAA